MSIAVFVFLVLLLLGLGLVSAALSALETALSSLREHHEASIAGDDQSLRSDLRSLAGENGESLNHVVLFGATINLSIAAIALYLIRHAPFELQPSPFVATIAVFAGIIVATDLVPKLFALANPAAVFRRAARPVLRLIRLLRPLVSAVIFLGEKVAALLVPERIKPNEGVTEDELETLVELRRDDGVLQETESEMIQDIIRLGDKTAKDCMTPRVDAVVLSNESSSEEANDFIRAHPHHHIPVFRDSPDTIVGVLDVKACLFSRDDDYRSFICPPVFVPETMMALDVFKEYLNAPHQLAIVLDEFGGMEGVITHTDLIEEIIADAAPSADQVPEIQDLGKNRLLVAGNARLDEIGELLGLELEEEGIDTIGGLIFNRLDQLPAIGEKVRLDGIVAVIRKCSNRRIEELLVQPDPGGDAGKKES